jgi:hypothetical protein
MIEAVVSVDESVEGFRQKIRHSLHKYLNMNELLCFRPRAKCLFPKEF